MPALIDLLHDATVVKKFLDEFEKHPLRTLLAVAAVLLLTGAGIQAVMAAANPSPPRLTELPTEPARLAPDGTLLELPQPRLANEALERTLAHNKARSEAVEAELSARETNAPVTEREIQILNESGKVTY